MWAPLTSFSLRGDVKELPDRSAAVARARNQRRGGVERMLCRGMVDNGGWMDTIPEPLLNGRGAITRASRSLCGIRMIDGTGWEGKASGWTEMP